jgi:hypothetical protein
MKKIKLMALIAMAGIAGFTAHASTPVPFDLVAVKLTALIQTNLDSSSKIIKLKITNKDILNLIATEFTNTPAVTNSGAKLAVDSFFGETFAVLDKTNGVILDDATHSPNEDAYELSLVGNGDHVTASNETETKENFNELVVSEFLVQNGSDSISSGLNGATVVKETFTEPKDSESFSFSGVGNGEINSREAVITGTVIGVGKDNDDIGL